MGLKKLIWRKISVITFFIVCMQANHVCAGWPVSEEFIAGPWGTGELDFGIIYTDIEDIVPNFDLTSNGKVTIRDGNNRRVKVYSDNGNLELIVPYRANRNYKELTIADSYGFSGFFSGYGNDGTSYYRRPDQKVYIKFSPIGEVLQSTSTRPLELGSRVVTRSGSGYKTIIAYPDTTYNITANRGISNFTRDLNNYLYEVASYSTESGVASTTAYNVYKYDSCGKMVGQLTGPISHYEPPTEADRNAPTWSPTPIAEYGEPVIGPNGDVYAWVRSATEYKIVRWSWVDEDTDPKGGPDTPVETQALPSTSGIYLTWNPSPQDPGCVSGYEIERASAAGGPYSPVATVPLDEKQTYNYNDTTATAGATWYYRIRSASDIGNSDPAEVSAARP